MQTANLRARRNKMDENQNNVNVEATQESTGTKTFDDILSEGYQAEFDRRMTKGINTALAKREAELRKQWELEQDEKLSEAEKLASMNEKQKHEYELKKIQREKEDAYAELNAYKLKDQTLKMAEEKGLPTTLTNLLNFRTMKAEDVEGKIDELNEIFKKAVEQAVNDRLKEPTPTTKTSGVQKAIKEIPPLI